MKKILSMIVVGAALTVSARAADYVFSGTSVNYATGAALTEDWSGTWVYKQQYQLPEEHMVIGAVLNYTDFLSPYKTADDKVQKVTYISGSTLGSAQRTYFMDKLNDPDVRINANIDANMDLSGQYAVASLRLAGSGRKLTLDNKLTVETGGIIFANGGTISGGQLASGTGSLWVSVAGGAGSTIASDIVGVKGLDILQSSNGSVLTLSGNNTFKGDINLREISGGSSTYLRIGSLNALGDASNTVRVLNGAKLYFDSAAVNNGAFKQNIVYTANNSLLNVGTNKITLSGSVVIASNFNLNGTGELVLAGESTAAGNINFTGGTLTIANKLTNTVGGNFNSSVAGGVVNISASGSFFNKGTQSFNGNETVNIYGYVESSNVWTVSKEVNQYSGTFKVAGGDRFADLGTAARYNLNGGVIEVASGNNNSSIMNGASGTFAFNSGTLRVTTTGSRSMTQGTLLVRDGGNFDLQSTGVLGLTVNPLQHDSGGNARDGGIKKTGNGTLILTGANTYNGNTIVSSGTLRLAANASLKFEMLQEGSAFEINKIDNTGGGVIDLSLSGVKLNINLDTLVGNDPSSDKVWTVLGGDSGKYNFGTTQTLSSLIQFSNDSSWDKTGNLWTWDIVQGETYYTFNLDKTSADFGLLMFTTVPEPSTWLLLSGSVALLAVLRRRRGI